MTWTFRAYMGQISNTIITPSLVTYCVSARALNFNKEVFASPLAADYGFYAGSGIDDAARRFRSTLFAKCRGAWWSSVKGYCGNSFWFMRTNGYTPSSITYVCDFGYLYNQGTAVTCDDAAVLPALTVELTKAEWTVATPVISTDIVQ